MDTKQISIDQEIRSVVDKALRDRCSDSVAAAINSIQPDALGVFFHTELVRDIMEAKPVTTGLPASPGAATGEVVLSASRAIALNDEGRSVILVRSETNPDDNLGMHAAKGILTARGGLGSHAAIVARGWGKPAVVGAVDVHIGTGGVTIGGILVNEGDYITIDGSTGAVYVGKLEVCSHTAPPELMQLLQWADEVIDAGKLEVRVNADTPVDARMGRTLGAKGIGLCRTEHMFLSPDRLPMMRAFILSETEDEGQAILLQLEHAQVNDFEQVLDAMDGLPVKVRLLDPPLHEFLPDLLELTAKEATGALNPTEKKELAAVRRLHEKNPMIGTRGVRLGVVRSGLYEMQVRALATATANQIRKGKHPLIEIMIPLVINEEEMAIARTWVTDSLKAAGHPELEDLDIPIGAMLETPRAALVADALAAHADFFSFGTNDLTQMTFAFSRDDIEANMLPAYKSRGILKENPFAVVDRDGVGFLVDRGCTLSKQAKPGIKLSVCGEHAGNPESVDFFVRSGVDSVSCSPYRIPLSRLAVAQALLSSGRVGVSTVPFAFGSAETGSSVGAQDGDTPIGMVVPADEDFVLYLLRVRGFITPDGLMASLGWIPTEILASLERKGLVDHMEGHDMYTLSVEGTEEQTRRMEALRDATLAQALAPAYGDFLALNTEFKELCNTWQLKHGVPNDHKDEAYDKERTEALKSINERIQPVLARLAQPLPRLARYQDRLQSAANRVLAGEIKQFTGVMCESFHDIWMELHEDLMLMQGIDRAEEGSF